MGFRKLTVWCAQYDEVTLEARKARSYELVSLSGLESGGIVRYLMGIEQPSPETIDSIEGAIDWFKRSQLKGMRLEDFFDDNGRKDRRVIKDERAPSLWARFYNIESNRPIFCSRDGIPRAKISEISHERRNGYSWLGEYARDLLNTDYPKWKERMSVDSELDK